MCDTHMYTTAGKKVMHSDDFSFEQESLLLKPQSTAATPLFITVLHTHTHFSLFLSHSFNVPRAVSRTGHSCSKACPTLSAEVEVSKTVLTLSNNART